RPGAHRRHHAAAVQLWTRRRYQGEEGTHAGGELLLVGVPGCVEGFPQRRGGGAEACRVRDDRADGAESFTCRADELRALVPVRDIQCEGGGVPAVAADLVDYLGGGRGVPVVADRDGVTVSGECERGGPADAPAGSGDDRRLHRWPPKVMWSPSAASA